MSPVCGGKARLEGARRFRRYSVRKGVSKTVRFRLKRGRLRKLRRARTLTLRVSTRNRDAGAGTVSTAFLVVRRPR